MRAVTAVMFHSVPRGIARHREAPQRRIQCKWTLSDCYIYRLDRTEKVGAVNFIYLTNNKCSENRTWLTQVTRQQ